MITESKYLIFTRKQYKGKKTYDITVENKEGFHLGSIYWRPGWRRYVFGPYGDCDFDSACLKDITEYIDNLMKERKENNVDQTEQ